MEFDVVNKLFLELSQVSTAMTQRGARLITDNDKLKALLRRIAQGEDVRPSEMDRELGEQ